MSYRICTVGGSAIHHARKRLALSALVALAAAAMPGFAQAQASERSGEQIVRAACAKCHEAGKGGAPKIGDRNAWIPRVKQGLDAVVRSAIRGHSGMPARGGMADITDTELRSAVVYMFNQGSAPAKAGSGKAGSAKADPAKANTGK